jgi:hypothetical protein
MMLMKISRYIFTLKQFIADFLAKSSGEWIISVYFLSRFFVDFPQTGEHRCMGELLYRAAG